MTDTITITDLSKVATENNLPATSADALQATFLPFFERASEWREKAAKIKVTNLAQSKEMGLAREARLALKDIRVQTEKKRVQMKEDSLRTGRAIDGMANVIKFLIAPIEEYLQDQEDYAKRLQEKVQSEQRDLRQCEAGDLIRYFPAGVDLGTIADEEFAKYLHLATVQSNAIRAENERVEKERIEKEQREAAEREAMRVENERLKAEAAKVEAKHAEERERMVKAMREQEAEIAAVREKEERLRREAEAKAQEERERIAAENRAKMEADNAERERLRKEEQAKEAAEKAALEAPDREKLKAYARILWELPQQQFSTESGAEKFEMAAKKIREAIQILQS